MRLTKDQHPATRRPEQLTLFECVSVPNLDRLSVRKGAGGDRVMLDQSAARPDQPDQAPAEETYIGVADACRLLYGMDPDRLRELLQAGIIHGVRPNLAPGQKPKNHKWRVSLSSVTDYRAGLGAGR